MRLSPEEKIVAQWLALTFHAGLTHRKVHELVRAWRDTAGQPLEGLLRLGPSDWDACHLDTAQCAALARAKGFLTSAGQMIERLRQNAILPVAADQPAYPFLLASTQEDARPPLLFCVGDVNLFNRASVAIIGSRQPKSEALDFTRDAAQHFAARGIPIVSGFAEGVDRCASAAALAAGGTTVLVIAQGILTFSSQIKALRAGIERGQILIVSAFHPEANWETAQAMARNAIIGALSHDVIVSQAGLKGGAWEATRMALNQGRPVWVRNDPDPNLGHTALAGFGARLVEWPSPKHDWTQDTVCVALVELAQTRYDAAWTEAWLIKAFREYSISKIVKRCGIPTEKAGRICQVRGKTALRGFEDLIRFCGFSTEEIGILARKHGIPIHHLRDLRGPEKTWTEEALLNLFRNGSASEIHEASGLTGHILRRIIEGRQALVLESLQDLRKIRGIGPAAIEQIRCIFRLREGEAQSSRKTQPFQLSLFPEAREFSDWENRVIKPLDEPAFSLLEKTPDRETSPFPSSLPSPSRPPLSRKSTAISLPSVRKTRNHKFEEEEEKIPSVVRPDELGAGDFVPVLQAAPPSPRPRRSVPSVCPPSKAEQPLNLLLLLASQMRADALGCYGNTAANTPNLDRLAAEGALLERAYTVTTSETAARAALLTSRLPATSGLWMNGQALPEASHTLASQLTPAGYDTGWIGKLHLSPYQAPEDVHSVEAWASWKAGLMREWTGPAWGFQFLQLLLGQGIEMFDQGHFADQIALRYRPTLDKFRPVFQKAQRNFPLGPDSQEWPQVLQPGNWIAGHVTQYLKQHGQNPFCLACGFSGPAAPYGRVPSSQSPRWPASGSARRDPDEFPPHYSEIAKTGERFDNAHFEPCSGERERLLRNGYLASVSEVDEAVGKILNKLDDLGLSENTLVVFTSDCGCLLGEFGFWGAGPFHLEGLLRVPLLMRLPGQIPAGLRLDAPVSLLDLAPTVCAFLRNRVPAEYEGVSLKESLLGKSLPPREAVLVQSVSRRNPSLSPHSVITRNAKMTCYPGHPWGEFYNLDEDPLETRNCYRDLSGDVRARYYEHLFTMLDPTRFLPLIPNWES